MLSGSITPTSGDAWILGKNINQSMSQVRKLIGICPQFDILFPHLTVKQHLEMYANLKDVSKYQIKQVVSTMMDKTGLTEKCDFLPGQLSGGFKRKLSLAIALIGDSKVIFLDEPTSNLDPQSRRQIWDIIQNEKQNRTIIFTSHYMDECEILYVNFDCIM